MLLRGHYGRQISIAVFITETLRETPYNVEDISCFFNNYLLLLESSEELSYQPDSSSILHSNHITYSYSSQLIKMYARDHGSNPDLVS